MAGYFSIGIYHNKCKRNIGTLWRSAQLFQASYVFTIQMKYKWQPSDTLKSWRNVPFFHHDDITDLINDDFIKIQALKQGTDYSSSFEKLLRGWNYSKIFYGVGVMHTDNTELKTKGHLDKIDFLVFYHQDNSIKVMFDLNEIFN